MDAVIILVTGSRDWVDVREVRTTINEAYDRSNLWNPNGKRFLVVRHGDCPTGADHLASLIVYSFHQQGIWQVIEDPMPADWNRACTSECHHKPRYRNGRPYCPVAGNIRNQAMIDKGGIDEVHAFPLPSGTGTQDCIKRAKAAGLHVVEHSQHLEAARG